MAAQRVGGLVDRFANPALQYVDEPRVLVTPLCLQDHLVGDIADQRVLEAELRYRVMPALVEQAGRLQFQQRLTHLSLRPAMQFGDDRELNIEPDDSRELQ